MATPINMDEPVRRAETVPTNLRALRDKLRAKWQTTSIWDLGDEDHDYGFHRSRAWVLQSGFSRFGPGDYSVQGSPNQGGDANWVAALDFARPDQELAQIYARLDAAMQAGQLPQVRELLKETGHGHLSFWRSRANDDHTLLYQVMTGGIEEDDMQLDDKVGGNTGYPDRTVRDVLVDVANWRTVLYYKPGAKEVVAPFPPGSVGDLLVKLVSNPGGIDVDALAAAIVDDPGFKAALAQAAFEGAQRAETE